MLDVPQAITTNRNRVQNWLIAQDFATAIDFCQELIERSEDDQSINDSDRAIHWLYGLATLLSGDEETAQAIWMMAMMDADEPTAVSWTNDLVQVLAAQADIQAQNGYDQNVWLIRQHIGLIAPADCHNQLRLFQLELSNDRLSLGSFAASNIIDLLNSPELRADFQQNAALLHEILSQYLDVALADEITTAFAKAIRPYLAPADFLCLVAPAASIKIGHLRRLSHLALQLLHLCRELESDNLFVLTQMAEMAMIGALYEDAIELSQAVLAVNSSLEIQTIGSYYQFKAYLNIGGNSAEIANTAKIHRQNLQKVVAANQPLTYFGAKTLFLAIHLYNYLEDDPQVYRVLQNQILALCQQAFQDFWPIAEPAAALSHPGHTKLRIGYVCSCFYSHSVGWLARSLLKHHDQSNFDIYVYAFNTPDRSHYVRDFYANVTPHYRDHIGDSDSIFELVRQDEIDILIDLDSVTRDKTCTLMALKPAPIQVTWLGWDAIGMSAIDYYIADPYVLPDQAQDHYTEKLWRLPESYIGLDGFEVGVPTLRRSDLGIPDDAVVFLNPQRGFKLHPETTKRQLQIVKQTPNSYFLVKGNQGQNAVQTLFESLAGEIGLPLDRLRFLPYAPSEEVHRANLMVADVVLDTFPFNGATTTLEALWMERPIVTLVGQQFAARNSYTMMMNAGITEGISWTPEEYVAWGIRLGTEPELRQQIAGKLRQAKQSAPLWNGAAFARQMEAAYTAMHQQYLSQMPPSQGAIPV